MPFHRKHSIVNSQTYHHPLPCYTISSLPSIPYYIVQLHTKPNGTIPLHRQYYLVKHGDWSFSSRYLVFRVTLLRISIRYVFTRARPASHVFTVFSPNTIYIFTSESSAVTIEGFPRNLTAIISQFLTVSNTNCFFVGSHTFYKWIQLDTFYLHVYLLLKVLHFFYLKRTLSQIIIKREPLLRLLSNPSILYG